jgi:HEAT repeat protein
MKRGILLASIAIGFAYGQQPDVQQPHLQNARLETRAAAGGLEATLRSIVNAQSSPAWVGYAVPIIPGDRQMCCWNDNARGCFLEPSSNDRTIVVLSNQTVKLEGPTQLVVLYRVENRQVGKVRSFSPECELDAGGLPFIWLTSVNAAESVKVLEGIAKDMSASAARDQIRRAESAESAIAMHADPAADRALEDLVASNQPEQVRRQATFGLAQRNNTQALNLLAAVAHNDKSPHVRGQALFWLAQRAGQKIAEAAINDAIANDPETEVKKKAVFALTQMPAGQGVPLLIQVARTNRNPEVRKQAVFWLGQSKDERALAFIEEVLTSKR